MLFNSYIFIFAFLPLTFFIYFYLNQKKLTIAGKVFLVISSLFFYAWWNVIYLPIILASIIFNYLIGHSLNKNSNKLLLAFGITSNIALLGYFKYSDFFIENYNLLFDANMGLIHLALPLAISFFTFQQISYLVDSYRAEIKESNFLNYSLYVTFFPQLIAGPIVHHKEMMPQFEKVGNKVKNYKNITMGLFVFSIGLFKKVVIADTFAVWATAGFDTATTLNLLESWITSLSYTFQLYFDFSGYTDMAIGIALLFNIKLPINFNSPYKATNIQDFWRRWHMTLGRFLKDYVYIPLGGNQKGRLRTYHNLLATFIIAGLWHGAGWTFLLWGFLHGLALVIHRIWSKLGFKLWTWIAWFLTFNFINITWVFFRAKEWDDAIKVLSGMVDFNALVLPIFFETKLTMFKEHIEFGGFLPNIQGSYNTVGWILAGFILILFFKNSMEKLKAFKPTLLPALLFVILFVISFYKLSGYSEFLYFRF